MSNRRNKEKTSAAPRLNIAKLGIVSRDYRHRYANGYRDFSAVLPAVLTLLDREGCDAVLFALFSVIPRQGYNPTRAFVGLRHIRAVLLEEFRDGRKRIAQRYVVYRRTSKGWEAYTFWQQFGSLAGKHAEEISKFVCRDLPKRMLGNCGVLLCGESNAVKYSPRDGRVHDPFGLRAALPAEVRIILNPVHDRMTRFEMRRKRRYLSDGGRWVVSVWNKGKRDSGGRARDGQGPAWTVFHDRRAVIVPRLANDFAVEIGILELPDV